MVVKKGGTFVFYFNKNNLFMMYNKKTILLFMAVVMVQFSFCQNFSVVDNWLDENIKDLGGRAVVMVYKEGKVVYVQEKNEVSSKQKIGAKWLKRKTGKEIDLNEFNVDTKQRIASCSKWLTTALAMTFIDEGNLNLEDTIGKFLPVMTAHNKGKIKIWQCLSHLTGIKQNGVASNFAGNNDEEGIKQKIKKKDKIKLLNNKDKMTPWNTMQQAIDSIASDEIEGENGYTFHYGNAGLQIVAAVLEKIGGKDFETLFEERIAKPLQMNNTDFGNVAVPLAAGGAWSTPNDYLHFLQMILNEGSYNNQQIISKESVVAMQKNYVAKEAKIIYSPAEAGNWGYGFGEWTMDTTKYNISFKNAVPNCKRSVAVTSPGLFGTFPWVDNDKKYCAILFTMNIKSKGRNERYTTLKAIIDKALSE
jgi:CubicO group peptidase (beta-lactamase class C family)